MNKVEARALLAEVLSDWRKRSYSELVPLVGADSTTGTVNGEGGVTYQFEV